MAQSLTLAGGVSEKTLGAVNFDAEINADGSTLYLADGRLGADRRLTAADIAVARRERSGFVRLARSDELLANVNTEQLEHAPASSSDGLELFFTR